MPTNTPTRDFYAHFMASTTGNSPGMGLGASYTVNPYFMAGAAKQIVLAPYGIEEEGNTDRYTAYPFQIAVYVPYHGESARLAATDEADAYARTIHDAYKPYDDRTSLAKGLTFGSWHADSLSVHLTGSVEDIPSTGGGIIKAVVNVRLRNVHL